MNTSRRRTPKLARFVLLLVGALGVGSSVESGPLTIATEPLGTATSSIKPNVMFLLDDSGSMFREYMPEYVVAPTPALSGVGVLIPGTAACFDDGDTGDGETAGNIAGAINACRPGDPPYMSPDFNTIYYNPAIYYRPALNYDGTEKPLQDAINTADWTKVRTDEYNVENWHQLVDTNGDAFISSAEQTAAAAVEVDLANGYPDRVWCTSTADAATGGNCRQNSAYTYPNYQFPFGTTNGTTPKYVNTAPYYYRMQTAQYCRTDGTDCKSGSAITAAHTLQAIEFCTDSELTTCAAGTSVTTAHTFSGVRWCSDAGTLQTCQRKKIGAFVHAKHLGTTASQTGTFAAVPNEGQITVGAVNPNGGTINSITIGGVSVIAGAFTIPAGSSAGTAASLIASNIQAHASSPEFNAVAAGSNVIITQFVAGSAGTGATILVNTDTAPSAAAKGSLTLATVVNNTVRTISSITVGGTQLLCPIGTTQTIGNSVRVMAPSGNIEAGSGWNVALEVGSVMDAIAARITACALGGGYSAVKTSANTVEIRAPLSAGTGPNGATISVTGTSISGFGSTPFAGGAAGPTIPTTVTTMSGGADAFTGTRVVRLGVGKFSRTDITPALNTYPKASTRIDCLSSTCSYEEEMTNFANWYTYYRSRMKMMKTAAGRAFASIDDTYRVGFITINPGNPVNATKYLKVSDFTTGATGHKQAWYSKFYGQSAANFTPLREALSRVGWMFAGKLNTGLTSGIPTTDDPMTASCQPNFAILSTDGYWNKEGGQDLAGVAMGNQDNADSGYSTRAVGAFDGNLLSTTTASETTAGGAGTLADVAMYYYKTDLRTGTDPYATNNVPTTNKDGNSAQHMVTFTLGLGLDGELTYRSNYETATTGDFADIKSGLKNWPTPRGDTPSALDDLWHAAVNGRGAFFSARDPETLAVALTETLSGLQTRIGAGAAAATSNLQPVAGDNFAFTAQYQTADWIGDLKAKTIDLSSGIVSAVTLWSAASLLDLKAHTDRNIFTHDPSDTTGNLMKHLCWPAAGGTTCSDGGGLTLTEQGYFNPTQLLQYPFGSHAGKLATASGDKVLNFFRGERTYEDSGGGASTDLFRLRDSILGDIINAQPAYVKKSPFAYGDAGYADFQLATTSRRGTVYAASNDGFLHAFETDVNNNPYFQTAGIGTDITSDDTFQGNNTGNGVERWAYVPGIVLPNAYKLANKPYSHRYFTDGSPQVGDICVTSACGLPPAGTATASDWRTILVAGLNSGGIGYYALDVTDPQPTGVKVMWEFTNRGVCYTDAEIGVGDKTSDCHLGLSYGNPLITKIKTGPGPTAPSKWVVIVTSGYNNTVSGGDGKGYLYILEASTGKILYRLATPVGTAASPSGLAKINGWATNSNLDNTVLAVYGGDLAGNLWRFDLDPEGGVDAGGVPVVKPGFLSTVRVATVVDAGGVAQPITVKPELGPVPNRPTDRMILFGTGKFLENADKTDTSDQTIYALKDVPTVITSPVIVGGVRGNALIKVRQFNSYTIDDPTRTVVAGTAPSWATDFGWLLDLPDEGERVNVDPQLQLGTLVVASNVPSGDTCTAGGFSWINFLDYATGSYVPGASGNLASNKLASSIAVGINVIMLPGGKVVTIVTTADNQQLTQNTPVPSSAFAGRRVSWRELIKE